MDPVPPPTPPGVYDLFGCSDSSDRTGSSSISSASMGSLAPPRLVKESLAASPLSPAVKESEPRQERALTSGPTLASSTSGLSELLQQQLQVAQVSDAALLPPPPPALPLPLAPALAVAPESPGGYELFPAGPPPTDMPTDTPTEAAAAIGLALFPSMGDSSRSLDALGAAGSETTDLSPPPPPATLAMTTTGAPVLPPPSYKMSGNAVDIVAVRNMDDQFLTTSWHVMFNWSRFRSNATTGVGDMVRILVNGKELPTKMELLERGRCVFITGGVSPPPTDLLFCDLMEDQPNHVRFEHFQRYTNTVRYVDARLHLWSANESVVVVDLDGTLTISDVEGHIRTLRLGQYDFLHPGACDFFTKLHELDMRIVYLTARPLDWASASRLHLENAAQQVHSLPPGVLITSSNGLTGALFTEVVNKTPHVFKAQVLNEIQLTLIHAGRLTEHPVFVAGFGNRPTDIIAYEQVGVDPCMIFLLDPYSNLRASSDPRIYESYADPNALLWLLPRLKHRVPLEKVARIDDYTVRELVMAEEREQLLMAERKARELQEQEYVAAMASTTDSARSTRSSSSGSTMRSLYGYP